MWMQGIFFYAEKIWKLLKTSISQSVPWIFWADLAASTLKLINPQLSSFSWPSITTSVCVQKRLWFFVVVFFAFPQFTPSNKNAKNVHTSQSILLLYLWIIGRINRHRLTHISIQIIWIQIVIFSCWELAFLVETSTACIS